MHGKNCLCQLKKKFLGSRVLLFTNSADEDGDVQERKKRTELKRAAVVKYLKEVEDGNLDEESDSGEN